MDKCIICKKRKFNLIWNEKIRNSANTFTKEKEKVLQCINCNLVFLKKKKKYLENSAVARNIFNKNNSIKEFFSFHTKRELGKIKKISKYVNFQNKTVLESNCGAGILINILKNKAKITAGLDNNHYKKFVQSKGHEFYENIPEIINKKVSFDIILSLSELEHKYDPIEFIKLLKKCLKKNGILIFRIPNFYNIYLFMLYKKFLKYDYRSSHNYYFSEKNLDLLFKNLNLKIVKKMGYNEYSFNHLLTYIKTKKRVKLDKIENIFSKKEEKFLKSNIENSFSSTSLIYILKK